MDRELPRTSLCASMHVDVTDDSPSVPGSASGAAGVDHQLQFFETDSSLYPALDQFFNAGQRAGEPLIAYVTQSHRQGFKRHLRSNGHDVEALCRTGQLAFFDVAEAVTRFMVRDGPDADLFRSHIGSAIDVLRLGSRNGRVRAYSEMLDLLWKQGNQHATVALETLWNDLSATSSFSLLCCCFLNAYRRSDLLPQDLAPEDYRRLRGLHSHTMGSSIDLQDTNSAHENADEMVLLRHRTAALDNEVEHGKQLEAALRQALAERARAEKAMRQSQQELADFIENAADGFHWVAADGVILAANRAELELLGYSRDEYVGHNIAEFHLDPEAAIDILARLKRNETIRAYEMRLRAKDGAIKHVLLHSSSFVRDGEVVHSRCLTRDITDRKKLEDELRCQNEDLLRTVRFSEMFVGILGHDLRNPLSAIMTGASLLQRRGESEKVVKTASRILSSAGRMGRMIDQVLDFTRIRLGRGIPIQPRRADLAEICRVAIDEFENTTPKRRIAFVSRGDTAGSWDADRIVQLVSNLLGNALTHGDPALPVTVSCDGTAPFFVQLDVHNAGTVPADLIPVLFEAFRTGSNEKQERSHGLGLGLFISQQIAFAHSGTIHVTSSEEDGTHLIVRLPRDFPAAVPGLSRQGAVGGAS